MITRILLAASLVGCVAQDSGDMADLPDPQPEEPPAPMAVSIDWSNTIESGGGFDLKEIAANPLSFGGGFAVIQLVLGGSVTAPGGSTMKLQINHGTGWWEYAGMSSNNYASASCGSWQMTQDTLFGHICTAPGTPTAAQTTTWNYSMAELFDISGTSDDYSYTASFHIRILDGSREIECHEILLEVARNTQLGGGSSFENGPCT